MQFIQINAHYVVMPWMCVSVCLGSAHGARELSKAYRNGPITMMHTAYLLDSSTTFVFQHTFYSGLLHIFAAVAQFFCLLSSSLWSQKKHRNDSVTNANRHWPGAFSYWWWTTHSSSLFLLNVFNSIQSNYIRHFDNNFGIQKTPRSCHMHNSSNVHWII